MKKILLALLLVSCSRGGATCGASVCEDFDGHTTLVPPDVDLRQWDLTEPPLPQDLTVVCVADLGQAMCSVGQCVDTRTSNDHCGKCDSKCFGKPEVQFTCCAGKCTGLTQDQFNCGKCGVVCPIHTHSCCAGVCKPGLGCS